VLGSGGPRKLLVRLGSRKSSAEGWGKQIDKREVQKEKTVLTLA